MSTRENVSFLQNAEKSVRRINKEYQEESLASWLQTLPVYLTHRIRDSYTGGGWIYREVCVYIGISQFPLGIKAKDEELKSLLYFQKCSSMKEL